MSRIRKKLSGLGCVMFSALIHGQEREVSRGGGDGVFWSGDECKHYPRELSDLPMRVVAWNPTRKF